MNVARRWFPLPHLSAVVFAVWVLASNAISPASVVMAALIGWAIPWLTHGFWPDAPRPRRLGLAAWLLLVFLRDMLVANFSVALRVIRSNRRLRPAFVEVPLTLKDEFTIAILAAMITLTPGTVSADVSPDRSQLFVHVLDTDDPAAIVASIKQRYEARLLRIFA